MQIRHAIEEDIPKIVELLKMSLGESLMPKSEAYWRWKHVDNPFGKSPVLIAEESGTLIGVRAFMRWEWTDGNNVYKAVRAVDTATHPAHQGKGIFKKLTLQLIDVCKQEGVHFIFNTPNGQSRPGYLKMGWQDAGRLPVRIVLGNPVAVIAPKLFGTSENELDLPAFLRSESAEKLINRDKIVMKKQLITNYNSGYLRWRYCLVPVADYRGIYTETGDNQEMLIYRLKKSKAGVEFRVTDYFGSQGNFSPAMQKVMRHAANRSGAAYFTFSGANDRITKGFTVDKGPMVTIRDIQYGGFSALSHFGHWRPSLGDLELF